MDIVEFSETNFNALHRVYSFFLLECEKNNWRTCKFPKFVNVIFQLTTPPLAQITLPPPPPRRDWLDDEAESKMIILPDHDNV